MGEHEEYLRVIDEYLDGELDEQSTRELSQWISSDPRHARMFAIKAFIHSRVQDVMRWEDIQAFKYESLDSPDDLVRLMSDSSHDQSAISAMMALDSGSHDGVIVDLTDEMQRRRLAEKEPRATGRRKNAKPASPRHVVIPRSALYGGIAVAAALVLMVLSSVFVDEPPTSRDLDVQTVPAAVIATYTQTLGATWEDAPRGLAVGDEMIAGEYRLREGMVKLRYQNGAEIVVEAPCHFTLESVSGIELHSGRLTGLCPQTANGFTVETPRVSVVDLGTEFGVHVGVDREAEVHVFDGLVELASPGAAAQDSASRPKISQGQAATINRQGDIGLVPLRPLQFVRQEEFNTRVVAAAGSAYHRWLAMQYDLLRRDDILAYYSCEPVPGKPNVLTNLVMNSGVGDGDISGATWDDGPFADSHSLRVASPDDHIRISVPGQFSQMTIAMWVNLDSIDRNINALLMTNGYRDANIGHWQIIRDGGMQFASGPGAATLPPGVTSVEFLDPKKDTKKWMHLAVTFDQDGKWVSFYRNGQMIQILPAKETGLLEIGEAEIGNWAPDIERGETVTDIRTMDGRVGEVLIFKKALSGSELQRIYEAGRPGQERY